jgi:hypothetical protein
VQFEDQEEFTHSFHVTFARIQAARWFKKKYNNVIVILNNRKIF